MKTTRITIVGLWLVCIAAIAAIAVPQHAQAQTSLTLELSRVIPSQLINGSNFDFFTATYRINYTRGPLKLAGDQTGKSWFWTDDRLTFRVTHADGTVATFTKQNAQDCTPPASYAPLDITSYFKPGANRIDLALRDTCGVQLGASALWLIGSFSFNPDYNFLYTLDLPWRRGVVEPRLLTQDWQGHWATGFALDFQHTGGGAEIDGTALLAPLSGTIKRGWGGDPGLGNFVSIDGGNGWQVLLAHMKEQSPIPDGAFVNRGDLVGYVGDSGADNIHIHVEARRLNDKVDPNQVLSIYRKSRDTFKWDGTNKTFKSTNGPENRAFARPAWATSGRDGSYTVPMGNDGSVTTRWSSQSSSATEWWTVNLDTELIDEVTINWEAAYAARHFVGWSNDGIHFLGNNYTISQSGPRTYTFPGGARRARYVGVAMYEHAPGLGNYSFWEFSARKRPSSWSPPPDAAMIEAQPVSGVVMMERTP